MKKVLITGGSGYIGQYIADLLSKSNYDVTITSRNHSKNLLGYSNRYMDLLKNSTIVNICQDMDIVIHLANWDERQIKDHPCEAYYANSYATRELYLDAVHCGVHHFIYFSTFHVYGLSDGTIDECYPTHAKTDYALSHLFAEMFLQQQLSNDCKVSVIRLTNGIGVPLNNTDKWYLVLNDFCKTAYLYNKILMKSNGLPLRDFVALQDVAYAIKILIEQPSETQKSFDVYNVSAENTFSIRDLAYEVKKVYQQRYHREIQLYIPKVTDEQIQAVKPLTVYSTKIRSLGWTPSYSVIDVINQIFHFLENSEIAK